jgi:hypothetical protein
MLQKIIVPTGIYRTGNTRSSRSNEESSGHDRLANNHPFSRNMLPPLSSSHPNVGHPPAHNATSTRVTLCRRSAFNPNVESTTREVASIIMTRNKFRTVVPLVSRNICNHLPFRPFLFIPTALRLNRKGKKKYHSKKSFLGLGSCPYEREAWNSRFSVTVEP